MLDAWNLTLCLLFLLVRLLVLFLGRLLFGFGEICWRAGVELKEHGVRDVILIIGIKNDRSATGTFGGGVNDQRKAGGLGFAVNDAAEFVDDIVSHALDLVPEAALGLAI